MNPNIENSKFISSYASLPVLYPKTITSNNFIFFLYPILAKNFRIMSHKMSNSVHEIK